jgi:pilus assembly protein CpaB
VSGEEEGVNRKTAILGLLSGVICALAVFVFTGEVQAQADSERAAALERFGGEQVQACVATADIAAGETINTANVAEKAWIADLLPDNPVPYADALGRQATSPIVAGEVVCEKRFDENAGHIDVPEGLAAVSLPADDVNAVGGAVGSGMKVDIYLANSETAQPLAADVLVLSTSAGKTSAGRGISWVTVAVEAGRVQEFVSAADKGNLYFVIPGEKKGANDA